MTIIFFLFSSIKCVQYSISGYFLTISGEGSIDQNGARSKGDYTKIREINILPGPTEICSEAFFNFERLQTISISNTITKITSPFFRCKELKYINVAGDNQFYCSIDNVLYSKDKTQLITVSINNIIIDENVEAILEYAFCNGNSYQYKEIKIPNKVKSTVLRAINEAKIEKLTWGDSPSLEQLIGFDWSNFGTFVVPKSCKIIRDSCFRGSIIKSIEFQEVSTLQTLDTNSFILANIKSIEFPDSLLYINDDAFSQCTYLESIKLGKNVTTFSTKALSGCTNLKIIQIDEENPNFQTIDNVVYNSAKTDIIFIPLGLESINVTSSIVSIGTTLLQNLVNLTNIVIQDGNPNFQGESGILYNANFTKLLAICGGVQKVIVKSTVIELCEYCAYSLQKLTHFEFEENSSCQIIGPSAFQQSTITELILPDSVTEIGQYAFEKCKQFKSFVVSSTSNLETIKSYSFQSSEITSVYIPSKVTLIDSKSFSNCQNLTNVTFAEMSQNITLKDDIFSMTSISTFVFPNNIESLGNSLLANCYQLKNVVFSDSIHTVPESTCLNCISLEEIVLPDSIDTIKTKAFSYCTSLKYVYTSASTIEATSFSYCTSLETFNFSSNISSLDSGIFRGCNNLKSFHVEAGSQSFKTYEGVVFDNSDKKLVLYPPGLESAIISLSTEEFGDNAFAYSEVLKYVTFLSGNRITVFPPYLFLECVSLQFIQFPSTITTISDSCFASCASLKSLILPSSLQTIGENAFSKCGSLKQIKYCGSNTIEQDKAFDENTNDIIISVTVLYKGDTFCSLNVHHSLTPDCELQIQIPTCEKHYCGNISYLKFAIMIVFTS